MKIFKALLSSLVLLLVGCEELGIDVSSLDMTVNEVDLVEEEIDEVIIEEETSTNPIKEDESSKADIYIKGIETIEIQVGQEIDLKQGVEVVGVDDYELTITTNLDRESPGEYVALYQVVVADEVVFEAKREVIVFESTSLDTSVTESKYLIHVIGSQFDSSMLCDGVDDDCDGIAEKVDLTTEGLQYVLIGDSKVPVFVVEEQNVVNTDNMRFYVNRKLAEEELKAIEVAGELYTMHKAIGFNPLATGGSHDIVKSVVNVTDEQLGAFVILEAMHLEGLYDIMQYSYPKIGDEVLICFQEENITRISLIMDTSQMKAKEKANKTKCSNSLRMYLDEDSDNDSLGDTLYLDRLRNSSDVFRTDSFFDIEFAEIERILGRNLTTNELRAFGGIDDDCDGYCVTDPFERILGRFYKDEYALYTEYFDLFEFVSGVYDVQFESPDPTVDINSIRIELAAYTYVREIENGFGHDLSAEEVDAIVELVTRKFKAGADLSSKVNLRGMNPIYEENQTDVVNPLFESMERKSRVRKAMQELKNTVYGPGDAYYGSIQFILGRDLTDTEIVGLSLMENIHMDYYDKGGASFLEASLDEIISVIGSELDDMEMKLLEVFQSTLKAQDYNSSRSNTTS